MNNTTELEARHAIEVLLEYIGEDTSREGLLETPKRVIAAWDEWCSGYSQDPKELLKTFKDGGEGYEGMLWEKDLPFYSTCEHHLASFFGTATIAYIPNGRVVGLSKLGRVLDVFARRLQVQERLTAQVAHAINDTLKPKGVAVLLRARHLCMESRGYNKQGHQTITCVELGVMKNNIKAREEFLRLA